MDQTKILLMVSPRQVDHHQQSRMSQIQAACVNAMGFPCLPRGFRTDPRYPGAGAPGTSEMSNFPFPRFAPEISAFLPKFCPKSVLSHIFFGVKRFENQSLGPYLCMRGEVYGPPPHTCLQTLPSLRAIVGMSGLWRASTERTQGEVEVELKVAPTPPRGRGGAASAGSPRHPDSSPGVGAREQF